MKGLYSKYKIYCVTGLILSIPYNLGFLWFYDESNGYIMNAFLASTGIALLLGSVITDLLLDSVIIRRIMMSLLILGIVSCINSMVTDLTLVHYPDYPAFIIRIIVLFVLIQLFRRAWGRTSEKNDEVPNLELGH